MNKNRMIFVQLQQLISTFKFKKLADEHKTDKNVRSFSTWNFLRVLMATVICAYGRFCQFTKQGYAPLDAARRNFFFFPVIQIANCEFLIYDLSFQNYIACL